MLVVTSWRILLLLNSVDILRGDDRNILPCRPRSFPPDTNNGPEYYAVNDSNEAADDLGGEYGTIRGRVSVAVVGVRVRWIAVAIVIVGALVCLVGVAIKAASLICVHV